MPGSVIHGRAYRFMHVDDPNPAKICRQLRVVGKNPESLGTETVRLKT